MKKMMGMVLVLFCVAGFAAAPALAALRVVTALPDFKSIVESVGGPYVTVSSVARPGWDPHFVDPKPSFLTSLANADLVVTVGLELDQWMDLLIDQSRNDKIQRGQPGYLVGAAGLPILEIPKGGVDRSLGDVHPLGNPHYWLDPHNGVLLARHVAERLSDLDPDHADAFQKNYETFRARIQSAIPRWEARFKSVKDRRIVVYHNSWTYFAKAFGLTVVGYVEPKPGITPPPAHILDLITMIRKNSIRVIVKEPYYSNSLPDKIAADTGAQVLDLSPSVGGSPEISNYYDLFEVDTRRVSEALARGAVR